MIEHTLYTSYVNKDETAISSAEHAPDPATFELYEAK